MASLRERIVEELTARFGALAGWTSKRAAGVESISNDCSAFVAIESESKVPQMTEWFENTLSIAVLVVVQEEKADPVEDGGNALAYLDRKVAELEASIHSAAVVLDEQEIRLTVTGHSIEPLPVAPDNLRRAVLSVEAKYRHAWNDPTSSSPYFVNG